MVVGVDKQRLSRKLVNKRLNLAVILKQGGKVGEIVYRGFAQVVLRGKVARTSSLY